MLTIALGAWIFILSGGIANIALPILTRELGVSASEVVWVSVAFQIAAVSCTIPFAGLSETIGVRRMFVIGLAVFALGGVLCGLAGNFTQLTLARVLQGLGAAGISSVNAALVRRIVPEHLLGRAIASLAIVLGAAQGAAPLVGTFVLEYANWRWLFFYDLPLTGSAILLALYAIPRDTGLSGRFDRLSAALCVPTLGLGFFALDRLARGPDRAAPYLLLAVACAAGVLLVRRQRGRDRPLFPVDLLTLPRFALPAGVSALTYGAQAVALTALPFLLMSSLDMALFEAGLLISVLPLATLLVSPVAGCLCDRFPALPLNLFGCLVTAVGFLAIYLIGARDERALLTAGIVVIGVGFALFQNHNAKTLILGAPARRMAAAGGVQSTVRVIGQMLGPALVGISFHLFAERGTAVAILLGVGLCLAGAILAAMLAALDRRNRQSAPDPH